jgi:hypothetical protein
LLDRLVAQFQQKLVGNRRLLVEYGEHGRGQCAFFSTKFKIKLRKFIEIAHNKKRNLAGPVPASQLIEVATGAGNKLVTAVKLLKQPLRNPRTIRVKSIAHEGVSTQVL